MVLYNEECLSTEPGIDLFVELYFAKLKFISFIMKLYVAATSWLHWSPVSGDSAAGTKWIDSHGGTKIYLCMLISTRAGKGIRTRTQSAFPQEDDSL